MIPTFTDVQESDQCEELRDYFNSLGANLSEADEEGFLKDLTKIIGVCDLCFKEDKDSDKQSVLNSIVSLLIQVPQTDPICSELVNAFCAKLVEVSTPNNALICIKILQNLFEGTGENPKLNYDIYYSLVKIAGSIGRIDLVYDDLHKVRSTYNKDNVGLEKVQKLLRLLHEVLLKDDSSSAIVLLGFVDQSISNESSVEWYTNKIGGKPCFPESIDDGVLIHLIHDQIICRNCSNICALICQIQCSVDKSPAFRVIYVFACIQEKCNYFTVTRLIHKTQLSMDNQITPQSRLHQIWDKSGWSDDEDDENRDNLCNSNEIDQLVISKDTNWKGKFLPKSYDNSLNFKPCYINVENIEDLKSSKLYLTKKELKYCQEKPTTNEDGEKYENPEISTVFGNDKISYKFYKHLRAFPKQVIRYSWQGQALLNKSDLNYKIDACENCGSSRKFEFQLMPALISQLNFPSSSSQSSTDLNFGTVLIYTCSNNCDNKIFNEEKCIFLEEIDENIINKK